MLTRIKLFSVLISLIFNISCKHNTQHSHANRSAEQQEHKHHHEILRELKLNNGAKWKMPSELMANVENMDRAIGAFKKSNSNEYEGLSALIENETNLLMRSCTIKSESIDELHKWLEPHLAMIKDLKSVETVEEALPIISEIDTSFDLLRVYFE